MYNLNEALVEVGEAEEGLDVFYSCWCWPFIDCFDLVFIHRQAILAGEVSQIFDFFLVELTFFWSCVQAVLSEVHEDFPIHLDVFLHICGGSHGVVDVVHHLSVQ